ncbi:microtubule associated protein protein [Babesia ovis]|uniref:Microtubule associated protein protein n=1 Tax=Babesia ovis TaxID=5869 RepID=A0A9W5T7Z9_BABOV|nr:microtubule associated protein protein [Babesia ovis]
MNQHRVVEPNQLVGRTELIAWVNGAIGVTIERIEQCSNGAIYIQLLDSVHPGRVPLARVKFNAALEYEFLANYKILQSVFTRIGIDKHIDVQKLTKGRYQDNLEFLQWLRGYVDSQRTLETNAYDGTRRRVTAVIRNCIANNSSAHLNLGSVTSALPTWAQEGVTVALIKECVAAVKDGMAQQSKGAQRTNVGNAQYNGIKRNDDGSGSTVVSRTASSDSLQTVRHGQVVNISAPNDKKRRVMGSVGAKAVGTFSRTSTADTHIKDADSATQVDHSSVNKTVDTVTNELERSETIASDKSAEDMASKQAELNKQLEALLETHKERIEKLNSILQERERNITDLKQQLDRQKEQVENLKKQLGQAQAEKQVSKMSKDFYYNKLRKIEIQCQKSQTGQCEVSKLFDIMYATDNVV